MAHSGGVDKNLLAPPRGVDKNLLTPPGGVDKNLLAPPRNNYSGRVPPYSVQFFSVKKNFGFYETPLPPKKISKIFWVFSVKDFHLVSNNSELMLKMSIFHACLKLKYCSNTISTTTTSITTTTAIKIVNNSIYTVCLKISRASTKPPNRTAPRCGFFQWKKLTSISFVGKFICNGRNKFHASYNTGLLFPRILDSRATFKAVLMAVDMT